NSYSTGTYVDVNGETQEIVYFTGANSHVYQELYRYTDQAANNYILLHEDAALTKYAYTYSVDENGNISITFDLNAPRTFYSYAAATYQLTQDIRFNDVSNYANWSTAKPANAGKFSPLGNGKYPFSGTLDGAGHTIEGMYLYGTNYTAPFGHAKNATFKNLNIAKSFVVGAFYSSLLVGNIAGDLTIENCNVEGYLTVSSYASAMLVGNGSANALIKNVTISGNAVYTKNSNPFGAFMGSVGGTALLVNCANYANIESTQVNGSIAGFIGNCLGDKTLINCHNFGDLTVAGGGTSGGFVANIDAGSLYLYNCTNYGDVKIAGAGATGVVGGLIGNVGRNNTNCYIYNSANYGDVSAQNGLAGGIVGVTTANTPRAGLVVKNCLQAGTVTSAQENGAGLLLGGINNKSPNLSYSKQFTDNFYVAQGDLDLPLLADDTNFNASYDKFENNIAVTDAAAAVEALNANATAGTLPAVPDGSYNPWYVSSETGKALPALNDAQIGASLAMGSQLALNFYVKCNPLTQYRGAVFTYGEHTLTYKGQVKFEGDYYEHYVVGGIDPSKLNETAEAQLAEKNNGAALASVQYNVATYAQRKYGEAGEALKGLLYALAAYGEAAGSEGTFEAVTGLAYSADLVKADFDTLKENGLYPAPTGTSSSAIQMSLSIGTESVVPVVKVEGATEILVKYSWEDEVTSYPVSDSGIVVLDAVTANALYANISLTANGETVVWSVASFVNAIMESDLPTAEQKTLAQAMALYMDAVHTYAGMKK
ncbi:MAG: hypothetical protein J6R42_05235, partial [Clostridia bacterium]|nr:hypothetical protein [Clostridia bacterium]